MTAFAIGVLAGCGGAEAREMVGFAVPPPTGAPGGFQVARHGLAFPNFASARGLTVSDAVEMFGDEAVCGAGDGACTVDARVSAWIDSVSAAMAGGVCEGMVLFSLDRFVAGVEPVAAGLRRDEMLEARIAQLFATQFLPGVGEATTSGSEFGLDGLVTRIEAGLSPGGDPVTVGVYDDGAGHSLLPVAVARLDDDRVVVAVYDVNWPGSARALEIDLATGSWRYSIDAVEQATDPAAWVGGASAIDLTPLSSRADLGSAPFAVEAGRSVLTATFHGDGWSVTTSLGRVDAEAAVPGEVGVLAVGRGARGTTTVVVEASGTVDVASSEGVHIAARTPSGWLSAIGSAGGEVRVDGSTSTMTVLRGQLVGSTASAHGEVEFPGREGLSVSIGPTAVVLVSPDWGRVVARQPVGERTDWIVTDDGSLVADVALRLPESIRGPGTETHAVTVPGPPAVDETSTTSPVRPSTSTATTTTTIVVSTGGTPTTDPVVPVSTTAGSPPATIPTPVATSPPSPSSTVVVPSTVSTPSTVPTPSTVSPPSTVSAAP